MTNFCKWNNHEKGYICTICGFITQIPNAVRKCKSSPNLAQRLTNFIPALTSHLMAGSPKTTQEQINHRLGICRECPLFVNNICIHDSCGCNIKDTQTFFNKLYWADQECPIGKWEKIAQSGVQ